MLHITVCDRNEERNERLRALLDTYSQTKSLEIGLSFYSDTNAMLEGESVGTSAEIYFLECENAGIESAMQLRKSGFQGAILFMALTDAFALASFDVHPFYYFVHPIAQQRLFGVLDALLPEDTSSFNRTLRVCTQEGEVSLCERDILYVDVLNRIPRYHMRSGNIICAYMLRNSFKMTLAPLLEENDFALGGVSLIVNLSNVKYVKNVIVLLKNGEKVYLSRSHASAFSKKYDLWKQNAAETKGSRML